jgi:hypothetical protein
VAKVGSGIDDGGARIRADEIVLLSVTVKQRWVRIGSTQRIHPGDDRFDASLQLLRELSRIDRRSDHGDQPALHKEIRPVSTTDRTAFLSQVTVKPVEVETELLTSNLMDACQCRAN